MSDRLKSERVAPTTWVIIGILLLAASLRLGWPGVVEFKYDEAMISRRAIAFAQLGIWPASTISSIPGIPQPPMKALLLAIPYAFTRNPIVAAAFQGLLGVITVSLTYWFGKRYFSQRAGLIAAAILAAAPWAIFYDRKLWSQNVPLLTILMMIGLCRYVIDCRPKWIVLALALLGALIGFYLGNAILAAVVLLGLVLFSGSTPRLPESRRRWKSVAWLVVGVIALFITLLPYLNEVVSGRANLAQASKTGIGTAERRSTLFEQIDLAASIGTGYHFESLAGDQIATFPRSLPIPDLTDFLDLPAVIAIIVGMAYAPLRAVIEAVYRRDGPGSKAPHYGLLAGWIVVPIGVWAISGMAAYTHRYIMLYPTQAVAAAILLSDAYDWLVRRWPKLRTALAALIAMWLAVLTIWHVILYAGMMNFVSTNQISGGHGRPASELWAIASQARALAELGHLPVVLRVGGDDPEHEGGPAEFDALLGDLELVFLGNSNLDVQPQRDYVVVAVSGDGSYRVERRAGTPPSVEAGIARMDNGIDLLKVALLSGDNTRVALTYRIWNLPPPATNYGYTVQLFTASGQLLGKVDAPFLRTVYWHSGDTVIVTAKIPLASPNPPPGPFHLLTAMYAYVSDTRIEGVNILDIAGNPAGQAVTVPLK